MAAHSGAFLASPWDSGLDPGGDSRWNCVGGSTGWAGDGLWAESPGRNFPCRLHARLQSCGPSPHRSAALGTRGLLVPGAHYPTGVGLSCDITYGSLRPSAGLAG